MSVTDDNITPLPPRQEGNPGNESAGAPDKGAPAKQERGRSTIAFPYDDLDSAVLIAHEVHHTYGGQATMAQLAASLGQTAKSGAFRVKVSAARLFGLVTVGRETATLTDRGRRVLDSQAAAQARSEAFLAVPLYGALYERFKDGTLPDDTGLSVAVRELGVTEKQVQTARQVFQRSALQAGFFRFGNRRLVLPSAVGPAPVAHSAPEPERVEERHEDEDDVVKHPFIRGLLRELPDPEDRFPKEDRETWLAAAKIAFDLIYGKAEGPGVNT